MALQIICSGVVSTLSNGAATCSTGWMTQLSSLPFDVSQIDPVVATALFGGGFALAIVPWSVAWGFSQLFKLVR